MSKKKRKIAESPPQARAVPKPRTRAMLEPDLAPTRLDRWLALAVGVVVLTVYVLTLCPTVPGGDSGELIAVAHSLGVAHPPGYPLYVLLGKLFTYFPHGSVAWRVNLLSAVLDSGAAVILFETVRRWSGNRWAGILSAGLFAFSPLVWSYAIVAEVFPLNNLFVAILLYFSVRYWRTKEPKFALLGAFFTGLGLANHQTFLFLAVPISFWILWIGRADILRPKRLMSMVGCFALGLSPYLLLPIASANYPAISWGHSQSWSGFLTHFLRREYGTLQLAADTIGGGVTLWSGLVAYTKDLLTQLLYGGVLLAIGGVIVRWRRERAGGLLAVSVVGFLLYVIVFHSLANLPLDIPRNLEVTARFWQQPNVLVCVWAGLGFAAFLAGVPARLRALAPVLALAAVALQAGLHYRAVDQSTNFAFSQFGHAILDGLPPRAILLSSGDVHTNSVRYLQQGEGVRPDVRVLDRALLSTDWIKEYLAHRNPEIVLPGLAYAPGAPNGFTLEQFFRANQGNGPIFLSNFGTDEDRSWERDFSTWPWGVINEVLPKNQEIDVPQYVRRTDSLLVPMTEMSRRTYAAGAWEHFVWNEFWEADHRRARRIFSYSTSVKRDPAAVKLAIDLMERLIKRAPIPMAEMYRNLGNMYSTLLTTDSTAAEGMVRAWRIYLATSPQGDDGLAAIQAAVAKYGRKE